MAGTGLVVIMRISHATDDHRYRRDGARRPTEHEGAHAVEIETDEGVTTATIDAVLQPEESGGSLATTSQLLTPHQRQYVAWMLTRRAAGDSVESLASTLVDSQVDLNPHQVDAALFACRNPLSRGVILADEVGLGKTIEAGLVILQRWAERHRKILIVVPAILMAETKARNELQSPEVAAKAEVAKRWVGHASDHAASVGGKPWKYLLIPHDAVNESKRLTDYLQHEQKAGKAASSSRAS